MTGGSHEVEVKLTLLQILEILRSSTKDNGPTDSLQYFFGNMEILDKETKQNTDIFMLQTKQNKKEILTV